MSSFHEWVKKRDLEEGWRDYMPGVGQTLRGVGKVGMGVGAFVGGGAGLPAAAYLAKNSWEDQNNLRGMGKGLMGAGAAASSFVPGMGAPAGAYLSKKGWGDIGSGVSRIRQAWRGNTKLSKEPPSQEQPSQNPDWMNQDWGKLGKSTY
jgi:hypothetical protein